MTNLAGRRSLGDSPAIGLVGAGALSVQFGAALATKLFRQVGPDGATTLRLVIAALLLGVWAGARPRDTKTPTVRPAWSDVRVAAAFGLVLAAMNLSFYEAIDRIPLGAAVTIEFSGPLALSLFSSRRWLDALWAAAAGAGVALLASGAGHHLNVTGVLLALMAGTFWVGYILLSRMTGQRFRGLTGLTIAMTVSALAVLPFGLTTGAGRLFGARVLGIGASVAVLSSVIPYSLELAALRRVTPRAFSIMLSLDPAVAAAAGLIVLGQDLTGVEWVAIGLVIVANLGNSLTV